MRFQSRLPSLLIPLLLAPSVLAAGNDVLYTNAVTYCAEAKAVIVEEFDIAYHQSNHSVVFTFSFASVESNLNVSANIYLNAYGFSLINDTLDLCSYFEGVICPLPQVNFTGRCCDSLRISLTFVRFRHISRSILLHLQNTGYRLHCPQYRGIRSYRAYS